MTLAGFKVGLIAQPQATVFSVQGNYVLQQTFFRALSLGTRQNFGMGLRVLQGAYNESRTLMPYGGKVLKIYVWNENFVSASGHGIFGVEVNGVEQNTNFRARDLQTSNIGEFVETIVGEEVTFNAGDTVGIYCSSDTAMSFSQYSVWVLMAFNIGSATP